VKKLLPFCQTGKSLPSPSEKKSLWAMAFSLFLIFSGCGSDEKKDSIEEPARPERDEWLLKQGLAPEEQLTAADDCLGEWSNWRNSFASSSPYSAFNKNSDWPVYPSAVEQVQEGKQTIRLGARYRGDGIQRDQLELAEIRPISSLDRRDYAIVQVLDQEIRASESDTLTLVHLGTAHTLDLFFHNLFDQEVGQKVLFSQYPLRRGTLLGSPTLAKFYRLVNEKYDNIPDEEMVQKIDDLSLIFPIFLLGKLSLAMDDNFLLAKQDFFPSTDTEGSVVLLSDTHGLDEVELAQKLPSSNCLRELGFKKVRLVLEGFHQEDQRMNIPYIVHAFDLNSYVSDSQRQRLKADLPEAANMLESGKVQLFPNINELLVKMAHYEKGGVEVAYAGFESDYQSTFHDPDGNLHDDSTSDRSRVDSNSAHPSQAILPGSYSSLVSWKRRLDIARKATK
jgi:hypothetical protein